MTKRKIYLASSWRNGYQRQVLAALREDDHEVYDFRNPAPGQKGFAWSAIDPDWQSWDAQQYRAALDHAIAIEGYGFDKRALDWCDTCVCLLPCGKSAHLEAGYVAGQGKEVFFLLYGPKPEPELMYKLGHGVFEGILQLLNRLAQPRPEHPHAALLREVRELPDPRRNLLNHNERELIQLCNRLGEALSAKRDLETWTHGDGGV